MTRINGYDAIRIAEQTGCPIHKYADPIEDARENISIEDAREIASEDPSLVYIGEPVQEPLVVADATEAEALNAHFLHCGVVQAGDEWDTETAWPDPDRRSLARRLLLSYRQDGTLPTEDERRLLATCCGE